MLGGCLVAKTEPPRWIAGFGLAAFFVEIAVVLNLGSGPETKRRSDASGTAQRKTIDERKNQIRR